MNADGIAQWRIRDRHGRHDHVHNLHEPTLPDTLWFYFLSVDNHAI